jgi:hypothetical protein
MPTYTTSRSRTYEFKLVRQPDTSIRPYIVRQPSYGSRDTRADATHRLWDSNGPYVCWTKKLYSEREALQVASGWAARTDVYIDTGIWKR